MLVAGAEHAKQKWWGDAVAKARRKKLPTLGTARDQVRLLAQDGPLATAWLQVKPSRSLGTVLPDIDFRSLCRYWLGLPLVRDGSTLTCPACLEACDPFGDHFVSCHKNGLARRHNALRDEWARLLTTASVPHCKDVAASGGKRPADILLISWDRGRDVAIDFTVTNPLGAEAYPLNLDHARRHLVQAEKDKQNQEGPLCASVGCGFHPAEYSPWGGMGPSARWLLQEVTKRITVDLPHASHSLRAAELRQTLSLALAREVARELALRCRVIDEIC